MHWAIMINARSVAHCQLQSCYTLSIALAPLNHTSFASTLYRCVKAIYTATSFPGASSNICSTILNQEA